MKEIYHFRSIIKKSSLNYILDNNITNSFINIAHDYKNQKSDFSSKSDSDSLISTFSLQRREHWKVNNRLL